MAKLADTGREIITTKLEPGEQIRAVGYFRTGPFWAMILLSSWFAFALKYYWIGVTDKRLIIVRLNSFNKPIDKENYALSLTTVEVAGNDILVRLPDKDKPVKFSQNFGLKALTGLDINEFKAALGAH
jgi:hypothetical protein